MDPLKFGILGTAAIGPPTLILPACSHADIVVYAVAARSLHRAQEYTKKQGIAKLMKDIRCCWMIQKWMLCITQYVSYSVAFFFWLQAL